MIRPVVPADTSLLVALAEETGVFKPHELVALDEVLTDYHATNRALGHEAVAWEEQGVIQGFAYYAPASMTDRGWYLYWIAVTRRTQQHGVGSQLLAFAEASIQKRDGRLLLIETSSLPHYEPARRFYLKHGYRQAAVVEDFYAEQDHLVVFSKKVAGTLRVP